MTKIYLAGPYAARNYLRGLAQALGEDGHEITSSWLYEDHAISPGVLDAAPEHDQAYVDGHVLGDFADVERADVLLLATGAWCVSAFGLREEETTSGGRHVETGYAIARGKRVVVLGDPENIFHRGACCLVAEGPDATTEILAMFDEDHRLRRGPFACPGCSTPTGAGL